MTSLTFHSEYKSTPFYIVHIGGVIILLKLRVDYEMMFLAHSVARFIAERHFVAMCACSEPRALHTIIGTHVPCHSYGHHHAHSQATAPIYKAESDQ